VIEFPIGPTSGRDLVGFSPSPTEFPRIRGDSMPTKPVRWTAALGLAALMAGCDSGTTTTTTTASSGTSGSAVAPLPAPEAAGRGRNRGGKKATANEGGSDNMPSNKLVD